MDLAAQWLGVPQLVEPQDMVNPKVDEQSMMTYLAQYPSAKLKPGAPIRPKTNSARVRCYGKGLYMKMILSLTDKEKERSPADAFVRFLSLSLVLKLDELPFSIVRHSWSLVCNR